MWLTTFQGLRRAALLIGTLVAVLSSQTALARESFDACFDRHGQRFGLDGDLLRSIAWVESGMRPTAVNGGHLARTGSRDLGLMQINSRWLDRLRAWGITEADLRDPCTSIEVGAWILADLVQRHGNSWDAVGAYNAACTQLKGDDCRAARSAYAWKVWRAGQKHVAARDRLAVPAKDAPWPAPALAGPPAAAPGLLSSAWASESAP